MKLKVFIIFILLKTLYFSQVSENNSAYIYGENPWGTEISGENPWQNEISEENPWEIELSEENPWGNAYKKEKNISSSKKDSIFNNNTFLEISNSASELSKLSLSQVKYKGYKDFRGTNAFWTGFVCGIIFNIYGVIPGSISSIIPSTNEKIALEDFKEKNKTASPNQIKYYKKGIKNKRVSKTMSGVATGMLTQFGIIIIALILSF